MEIAHLSTVSYFVDPDRTINILNTWPRQKLETLFHTVHENFGDFLEFVDSGDVEKDIFVEVFGKFGYPYLNATYWDYVYTIQEITINKNKVKL